MVYRTEVSISQQGIWRYSSENPRWEDTVPALSSKLTWMRKGGPDSLRRASVRSDVSRSLQRSIVSCSQFTPPSCTTYCSILDHSFITINTRVMVYKGHREISILVAPLFLPKKPHWRPQGGPYFKTSLY